MKPAPFVRAWHVVSSKSMSRMFLLFLAYLVLPGAASTLAIVAAVAAAVYFSVSGRAGFEANRNYILWLGRKAARTLPTTPEVVVRTLCTEAGLAHIVPVRDRRIGFWYSPRRLQPLAEAFLDHPPELALHLVTRVLSRTPQEVTGARTCSSELAGDVMMTFERMNLLNPAKGQAAAYVLALGVMAESTPRRAFEKLRAIGLAELGSAQLQAEESTGPDNEMNEAVARMLMELNRPLARRLTANR